jgi:hypothetical protein
MEDSLISSAAAASQWNNMNNDSSLTADVYNESVTSAHHPIRYPREASYFAAACAILFVFIGIGGKKKDFRILLFTGRRGAIKSVYSSLVIRLRYIEWGKACG